MNEFVIIQKYLKILTYNNPAALNLNDDVYCPISITITITFGAQKTGPKNRPKKR